MIKTISQLSQSASLDLVAMQVMLYGCDSVVHLSCHDPMLVALSIAEKGKSLEFLMYMESGLPSNGV